MSTPRQILAAIFDMDGLLIDSEPLWDRAELDVMASLGVDISRRNELPDTLGLRIDMVVDLWYARQPWNGPSRQEVVERVLPVPFHWLKRHVHYYQACAKPLRYAKNKVYWWDWPPRHHYICWKKC